ncbi:hypothetical protein BG015_006666 [Linnemannia schmuckeri]|uniref:Uncharacterized protein n=1 Tax=Linnemannia schmuckeri TaxID=64567 RepID=A0A9P5RZG3_9FUNG|nr:hypothetical protein BG015_006666 [Linnemannia schmuckeri]
MHFKSTIIAALLIGLSLAAPCNNLFAITTTLDKQFAHAMSKSRYSCTAAQAAVIAKPVSRPPLNIILNVIWPIAFAQHEELTKRIAA